jgi:nitroalkane oxidase
MAIDFTLTSPQRELQLESRRFATEVLAGARAAELLPTAEERFLATRPVYEAMVVAGFLRKCIPQPAGGENAGLIDMAIMAEEFYSVNASVTLTMLGTVLGLLPILLGGTPEQCGRMLAPFLKKSGTPLAGFCSSEPGGSANAASPPPGEGVRTFAKLHGDRWVIIDSYDHEAPLGRLLQDALALPIFDGGNIGVRRRQLHSMLKRPDYEPLLASGAA